MKGDLTRNTFNPEKHFLRVLMQQGRVQLDADWNEQASILLHYIQTLAADFIGPYAGPAGANLGFAISGGTGDFKIGKGRYYVNGILCENQQEDLTYFTQADYPLSKQNDTLNEGRYMVYLDVWERHISYAEDDDIREKALHGADTSTRSKIIRQIKVFPLTYQYAYCQQGSFLLGDNALVLSQIRMSARAKQAQTSDQPCLTEPEASYRGAENQLYRVEIHDGNIDKDGNPMTPTFKFSRENGSVIFPVKGFLNDAGSDTYTVELEHLGRAHKLGLAVNDWVELVDDTISLRNIINPLFQVQAIDAVDRKVNLSGGDNVQIDLKRHALLRRWDQQNEKGVIEINTEDWIKMEDGIEVKFNIGNTGQIRPGDHWLIPARHVTGDVEWPIIMDENDNPVPKALPPLGTIHHYAPLAVLGVNTEGKVSVQFDCRCSFRPMSYSCPYNYAGQMGIGTDLLRPRDSDNQ